MSGIESKLAELATRFAARAQEERAAIAEALESGDVAAVIDRAHKLGGIAGMFGHHAIGEAAMKLEEAALARANLSQPGARLLGLLNAL